jgi:hypothetical protein
MRTGGTLVAAILAAFAIGAAPASATSVQTATGDEYVGPLNGTLAPSSNFAFTGPNSTVTCDESTFAGQISASGSASTHATGTISAMDWTQDGSQACADNYPDADSIDVSAGAIAETPWNLDISWIDDNTSGTANATGTLPLVFISLGFTGTPSGDCSYVGGTDFSNIGVQAHLYNPDNTTSGKTELRFVDAPFFLLSTQKIGCETSITASGTYRVTGTGGTNLQVRESASSSTPPAPTCSDVNTPTPYLTPTVSSPTRPTTASRGPTPSPTRRRTRVGTRTSQW